MAWLMKGEAGAARELAPGDWQAALQFEQQGPVAAILALLAALETRPRTAALLLGYAAAAWARTGVQPMPTAQLTLERAEAIVLRAVGDVAVARLKLRGATLSDASVTQLAFAAADAEPAV